VSFAAALRGHGAQECCIRGSKDIDHYKNCIQFDEGRWQLSKQLQDLNIDVVIFSETQLKPQERFYIPN
jgi:hypothetical protein